MLEIVNNRNAGNCVAIELFQLVFPNTGVFTRLWLCFCVVFYSDEFIFGTNQSILSECVCVCVCVYSIMIPRCTGWQFSNGFEFVK